MFFLSYLHPLPCEKYEINCNLQNSCILGPWILWADDATIWEERQHDVIIPMLGSVDGSDVCDLTVSQG